VTANNPYRSPDGKFGEKPVRHMDISDALKLNGSPPTTWQPYRHSDAARALYEAGLCLLAKKRIPGAKPLVGVWKAKKETKR
jgi:hypothetical protein